MIRAILVGALVLVGLARAASAYPQFQLSRDQTCTSCHLDPAGGLLLGENGLATAEANSTYGGAPEAAHGKLVGPQWLQVSADLRAGGGFIYDDGAGGGAFPMQADGDVAIHGHGFTFMGTFGPQVGHTASDIVASREHWLMWQSDPDATSGLYVRVGRFMPVYGLRFAEHTAYTRAYGGTPLYGEAYGAAVEYIDPRWEVHATGFVHDPLQDSTEKGSGGALYGETRVTKMLSFGVEGRYATGTDDTRTQGGVTAKLWLADKVLLEGEGQIIHQRFAAGRARNQLVSYLLASIFVHDGWLLDLGIGQYNEDLAVKNVDIEGLDANLHWFTTSHWELLLTSRLQTTALGAGGGTSGNALFQFHYRL